MPPLVLLASEDATPVARLLDALGVVFERRTLAQALTLDTGLSPSGAGLILSERELANADGTSGLRVTCLKQLLARYRHVLLYPFRGTVDGLRALSQGVAGRAEVAPLSGDNGSSYSVAADFPAAGPFAGLEIPLLDPSTDRQLAIRETPYPVRQIVSVRDRGVFIKITCPSSELFVMASSAMFDVEAEAVRNLEVRECFSGLVPLLFFLRHSQAVFWRPSYAAANVVIDDLNLRPHYGFVNAQTLARHVDELGCAVSIAFIPWNHDRVSRTVTGLFRSHWPHLSLSIHGCDHIGAEFSTGSLFGSLPLIAMSLDRMRSLGATTGIGYDRVMVFPQGKFSLDAMAALRQSDFVGSVNTELIDDRAQRGVAARELLQPAVTAYAGFPLFLRRKAHESPANFALDLLLGKPCLVVTHHQDFRRGMQPLISVVETLNALDPGLHWTNLETIVSRTYLTRANGPSAVDVRLFASRTVLEPYADEIQMCASKAEPLSEREFQICVAEQTVKGDRQGGDIVFRRGIEAGKTTAVDVALAPRSPVALPTYTLRHRSRVAVRRYLSEFRDNYVAKSSWATAVVGSARRQLSGSTSARRPEA